MQFCFTRSFIIHSSLYFCSDYLILFFSISFTTFSTRIFDNMSTKYNDINFVFLVMPTFLTNSNNIGYSPYYVCLKIHTNLLISFQLLRCLIFLCSNDVRYYCSYKKYQSHKILVFIQHIMHIKYHTFLSNVEVRLLIFFQCLMTIVLFNCFVMPITIY